MEQKNASSLMVLNLYLPVNYPGSWATRVMFRIRVLYMHVTHSELYSPPPPPDCVYLASSITGWMSWSYHLMYSQIVIVAFPK